MTIAAVVYLKFKRCTFYELGMYIGLKNCFTKMANRYINYCLGLTRWL